MKKRSHDAMVYIVCTPDLQRIEKIRYQSELPGMIKKLRKEQGTKKLQIFCRAYIIEDALKRQNKL